MRNAFFGLMLALVMLGFVSTASAAVTPAPEPVTKWISGASKSFRPAAGWNCWGDKVGSNVGPVVVHFAKQPPAALVMVYTGCAYEPAITKERRALWAQRKYGRVFKVVDYK